MFLVFQVSEISWLAVIYGETWKRLSVLSVSTELTHKMKKKILPLTLEHNSLVWLDVRALSTENKLIITLLIFTTIKIIFNLGFKQFLKKKHPAHFFKDNYKLIYYVKCGGRECKLFPTLL
jgi:hypothetical protein